MKKLTNKEREVMELFWEHGPMFVRELLEHYEEPKPLVNLMTSKKTVINVHVTSEEDGKPIVGASGIVEGTMNGADSDMNGDLTLEANIGNTVLISYNGYELRRLIISGNSSHDYHVALKKSELF